MQLHKQRLQILIASIVGFIGYFLPWGTASVTFGNSYSYSQPGPSPLWIIFLIIALAAITGDRTITMNLTKRIVVIMLGLLNLFITGIFFLAILYIAAYADQLKDDFFKICQAILDFFGFHIDYGVSPGIGIFITLIANIIVLFQGFKYKYEVDKPDYPPGLQKPQLLPDEEILTKSTEGDVQVILTTHRISHAYKDSGRSYYQSVMLEEVTSCENIYKKQVWLLVTAGIVLLLALISSSNNFGPGILLIIIIGCIIGYWLTRNNFIIVSSPTTKMSIKVKGMSRDKVLEFINKIEQAKQKRISALNNKQNYNAV